MQSMTTKGIMKKIIYLLFIQCFAWNLYATDNLTLPHQFQGGSRISASAINENFQAIVDYINQMTEADLKPNTTSKILAIADTTLYMSNDYINFVDIIQDCSDCQSDGDISFIGNKYFIGGNSRFFTSENGLIWNRFDLDARRFKFNNGKYYGYGSKSFYESNDAVNWTLKNTYQEAIKKLFFSDTILMGLLEGDQVFYTKPGTIGNLHHDFLNPLDLTFHKGYFVVSTSTGGNNRITQIYRSTNGYEWETIFNQQINGSSTYLHKLFSNDNILIAAGSPQPIYTNDFGANWDLLNIQNVNSVIEFKEDIYITGQVNGEQSVYMLNQNNFELELKLNANVYYLDSSNTVMVASGEDGFYSTVDGTNYKQANTFSLTNAITKTLLVE